MDSNSFAAAWSDGTSTIYTRVFYISGLAKSDLVTVTTSAQSYTDIYRQVAVTAINSTHYIVAWVETGADLSYKVFNQGTNITGKIAIDTSMSTNRVTVSLSTLNRTSFVAAWYDTLYRYQIIDFNTNSNNVDLAVLSLNTSTYPALNIVSLTNASFFAGFYSDTYKYSAKRFDASGTELGSTMNITPGGSNVDVVVAAYNSTRVLYTLWDYSSVSAYIMNEDGVNLSGKIVLDSNSGTPLNYEEIGASRINSTHVVASWYDSNIDALNYVILLIDGTKIEPPERSGDYPEPDPPLASVVAGTLVPSISISDYFGIVWRDNSTSLKYAKYYLTGSEWINLPPTISADSLLPTSPSITQTLTGNCTGSDPDGDNITFYYSFYSVTDATYKRGFETGNTYTTSAPLDSHDTFRVDCYAVDQYGATSSTRTGTTQRTLSNTIPTIDAPYVTPSPISTSSSLTCNHAGNYQDIDGDAEGAKQWLWYKNNVSTGITTASTTVAGLGAVKEDMIKCSEAVYDGYAYSIAYNSTEVQVQNNNPSIQFNPIIVNGTNHAFNFTSGVYDADGYADIVRVNISISSGECTNSKNSTSGAYLNTTFNCSGIPGNTATIVVQYTDASGSINLTTPMTNTYPNNKPVWGQTISSSSLFHNQNLSIQLNATDSDTVDTLTWGVNTSLVTINASGYLFDNPARTDYGNHSIRVNVTDGYSILLMNITYEVKNQAPTLIQAPSSQALYHNQNMSIQFNASDSESDGITWSINNSMVIMNLTGYLFDNPTQSEVGNYSLKISVTDNTSSTSYTFNYEVINRVPDAGDIQIVPSNPTDEQQLNCTITSAASDPESDSLIYNYNWYKNSVSQGYNNSKLAAGNTSSGESWYCTLYVWDGKDVSSTIQSQTVSIDSSFIAPTINVTNVTRSDGKIANYTYPANNNTEVLFSVLFDDVNPNEKWTAYFCRNGFNGSQCIGGEFCHTTINSTTKAVSCSYDLSPESTTNLTYYVYVLDNSSLSVNKQNSFIINYPPVKPNITLPLNNSWITTNYTTIIPSTNDPDSDSLTYLFYGAQNNSNSSLFTRLNISITNFTWSNLNETYYYVQVIANDSHGYSSSSSEIYKFGVDYTSPQIVNTSITGSPYYTDSSVTVYATCIDSFSGTNSSSVKYNITDALLFTDDQEMILSIGDEYADVYVPLGIPGGYVLRQFSCYDYAGNLATLTSNLTFTTTVRPVETGSSGGGGGGALIINPQTIINVTAPPKCGDGVCNGDENPGKCPADCKINFDELITCTLNDPSKCFYSSSWFVSLLLFFLIIGIIVIVVSEHVSEQSKKKKRIQNR